MTDLSREERLELEDEGYVVSHPDHDDVARVDVDDWEHVTARVTGLAENLGEGDGIDICMDQFATEGSVVELIVKGEVLVRMVQMGEPEEYDYDLLTTESPKKESAEDDVACADCGYYRNMVGPLDGDGNPVEDGDFVCWLCAESRGLDVEAAKEALGVQDGR